MTRERQVAASQQTANLSPCLGRIGQMALNGAGDLLVGMIDGDCTNVLTGGVVIPFFCAPGLSLRAVAVDENDNVYVTRSADGIVRMIAPDGTVLNLPGFVAAVLNLPDAPLPIITADMNGDGCADGAGIPSFVAAVLSA